MSKKYSRSLLRISVAQICQNLGWHSAQSSSLEVLTDVLERYLLQLGGTCHRYSEQFGRTEPNLDDLGLAFRHMGINLSELEDYVRHVDPVPFAHEVVAFPAPKPNDLGFPNPRSREILQHREEHIPDHLPYMFPNMKDEIPEEKTSPPPVNGIEMPAMGDRLQENGDKEEPEVGDKRPAPMSTPEMPPSKRSRFGNSNLPEEAGYSNYEMTCVRMGPNGVLTTRQGVQGRLPEPRMPPPNPRTLIEQANKENSGKTKDSGSGAKISGSVGGIGADGLPGGKNEGKKSKSKKSLSKLHKKSSVHEQAAKAALEMTGKEIGKKTASSKAAAKFLKKLKQSKKSAKVFSKSKAKDLKTEDQPKDVEPPEKTKKLPPEVSKKKKEKKQELVDSEEELRNLCSPTSSRGSSPERQIINDGEGNAKKKARLDAIDDSINAVLRDSPVKMGKGKGRKKKEQKGGKESSTASGEQKSSGDGKQQEPKVKRKPGRPPKVQKTPELPPPVDIKPFVSDKYSSAELQVYEFNDSPPDASVKQRRPSAAELPSPVPPPPTTLKSEQSSSTPSTSSKHSASSSQRSHRKVEPEDELFAPEIKFESRAEPTPPPDSGLKPVKLEFGKEKEKKGKEEKKEKAVEDKHKGKEEKLERQKEKRGKHKDDNVRSKEDKDKHKEKEHKKDKKEKRKEKEKKKKHKEKDRDKDKEKKREEKVKQESRESRESSPALGLGVKLKIKIGGAGPQASVMVTEGSSPASPSSNAGSKRESMSPPKVIPKLYISKKGQEEKTKKNKHHGDGTKRKSSPLAVSGKSRSSSPSSNKASPSPRSTPTPPVPRKTPTPPPPHKSPSKESQPSSKKEDSKKEDSKKEVGKKEERSAQKKKSVSPVPKKERKSRSPVKDKTGRKEKKMQRKRSISSLSSLSSSSLSSLSPTKTSAPPRRQSPPKLQRMSSSSPEKSPPSLPFQSPTPSPRASSRAARSPSHTSSPHRSPTPPPSLSRRKPTPPPALSPANARHQRQRSPSPSPTKPPTPGSTSPAASPDWNLPESPSHHRSPTPTPRTPTASPSRNIPSPSHSSPPTSPYRRSPSPVQPSSRPGSRQHETPEPKLLSKDNPSPASSGKSASSLSKPNRTVEAETVCVFYDDSGQKVWICPACKKPDDGSEMIGCDMCDNWYHWPCANITQAPPEEQEWYCGKCLPKTKASSRGRGRPRGRGRGRGRKKIT